MMINLSACSYMMDSANVATDCTTQLPWSIGYRWGLQISTEELTWVRVLPTPVILIKVYQRLPSLEALTTVFPIFLLLFVVVLTNHPSEVKRPVASRRCQVQK